MSNEKRKGDDLPERGDQESRRQKLIKMAKSHVRSRQEKKKAADAAPAAAAPPPVTSPSPDDRQEALANALQKEGQITDEIAEIKRKYHHDMAVARTRLRAAKRQTEKARTAIRAAGEVEYDSLLSLEVDTIRHMLGYLDIRSLGRCEVASRRLRQAATSAWEAHDQRVGPPQNRSAASDERTRAIRFHLASKYAQMCEPWIERHNDYDYNHTDDRDARSNRGYCKQFDPEGQFDGTSSDAEEVTYDDAECCFPSFLNTNVFKRPQDFEVFLRVNQANGGKLCFEGFIPSDHIQVEPRENRDGDDGTTPTLAINFLGLDFPNWPGMNRCLSLDTVSAKQEWQSLSRNMFHYGANSTNALLTTIIAVEKGKPVRAIKEIKPGLLAAFCEYSRNGDEVDDDGDPYYPFEHFEERHHFRVEGCIPACPHLEIDPEDWDACRYLWFAWSKSEPGKFAGIIIEDGRFRESSM